MTNFSFTITHRLPQNRARVGIYQTPHGALETPNFIFCGTKASIKGIAAPHMRTLGTQIILANTYHLMIQPGADLVERRGGLHQFMQWDGPLFTDSGGYQIFSMSHGSISDEIKGRKRDGRSQTLLKITEEGAVFRSYWNGEKITLTPEKSIDIQRKLGADLIVQLDECTPFHVDRDYTVKSMRMSHRWGDRSLAEFERGDNGRQKLYGIVQGGVYRDLREESSQYTRDRNFFATAIGGCLGETKEDMQEIVSWCVPHLHPDRPIHFLGVGGISDIFGGVRQGLDTFDCVSPTRLARHGWALMKGVPGERYNIRNRKFLDDDTPLDEQNPCEASRRYSRSYIHHLFRVGELLGMQLLAEHNVTLMNRLMAEIRAAIKQGGNALDILEKEWIVA